MDIMLSIGTKFSFIPFSGSAKDFHRFPILQPIRSHGSHLGCRQNIQRISHPCLVQFGIVGINMGGVIVMQVVGKSSLEPLALVY